MLNWNGYFKPDCPHIYQMLAHFKHHNKLYENISITKGLSSEEMFRFPNNNADIQGENDGEEINDNENETEYTSVEDPVNMHRAASNKTKLIFEIQI